MTQTYTLAEMLNTTALGCDYDAMRALAEYLHDCGGGQPPWQLLSAAFTPGQWAVLAALFSVANLQQCKDCNAKCARCRCGDVGGMPT